MRRDLVLRADAPAGLHHAARLPRKRRARRCPPPKDVQAPREQTVEGVDAGYFTSWVQQQVIERYGAPRAFDGRAAHQDDARPRTAARGRTGGRRATCQAPTGPTAVARRDRKLDRRGARDGRRAQLQREPVQPRHRGRAPAGLVVQGLRPRGRAGGRHLARTRCGPRSRRRSSCPARTARKSSSSTTTKAPTPGSNTLTGATAFSDNSIYAEVGLEGGHPQDRAAGAPDGHHDAALDQPGDDDRRAHRRRDAAGHGPRLRDDRPRRPARERHARRTTASPSASRKSTPAARTLPDGATRDVNRVETKRGAAARASPRPRPRCSRPCSSTAPAGPPRSASSRPARPARPPTTGTPGSSAGTRKYTVAVWVGYPDKLVPMTTDFNGQPVLGGTFPALIWHDFMTSRAAIDKSRAPNTPSKRPGAATTAGRAAKNSSGIGRRQPAKAPLDLGRRRHAAHRAGAGGARASRAGGEGGSGDPAPNGPPTPRPPPPTGCAQRALAPGRSPPRPRGARPASGPATSAPAGRRPSGPGGQRVPRRGLGRETCAVARAQKRQRSSTARVMPTRVPVDDRGCRQRPLARADHAPGRASRSRAVSPSAIPSACVACPGPEHSSRSRSGAPRRASRAGAHPLDAGERLERADQDGRADALRLAHRVQQRVDAVGAVDVGAPGRRRTACCVRGVRPTKAWQAGSLSW